MVITKVFFPRLVLPLSAVVSGLVDFAIGFAVLGIVLAIYGIHPGLAALWLPVLMLLAVLTALGVGLWMSALNALYRDIRYVVPFLMQFWMFASPVAYPSSLVPQRWRWLCGLNPLAGVIDGFPLGADRSRPARRDRCCSHQLELWQLFWSAGSSFFSAWRARSQTASNL